jgi:peptide-methionine (R)-S-oxide reductase
MKMKRKLILIILPLVTALLPACSQTNEKQPSNPKSMDSIVYKTDEEWRKLLTPAQFCILREKGTERPFTGKYDEFFEPGTYFCAACGAALFPSGTKYNSGCGWPAFYEPSKAKNVTEKRDLSHGMIRTEVLCSRCGGHLGHVFDDGPEPTGLRYCINSESLRFEPAGK